MNNVTIIGRLTKKPVLREIGSVDTTRFVVAVDRGYSDDFKKKLEEEGKPTADFIQVVCWGKMATNVCEYLDKGSMVYVNGRIEFRSFEDKNNINRYITEINASSISYL